MITNSIATLFLRKLFLNILIESMAYWNWLAPSTRYACINTLRPATSVQHFSWKLFDRFEHSANRKAIQHIPRVFLSRQISAAFFNILFTLYITWQRCNGFYAHKLLTSAPWNDYLLILTSFSLSSILLTNFYPSNQRNEWSDIHVSRQILCHHFIGLKVMQWIWHGTVRFFFLYFHFVCFNFNVESEDDVSKMENITAKFMRLTFRYKSVTIT